MKKAIVLILTVLMLNELHSQITKRNWIVGGNASISFLNSASAASVQYKQTDIQINTGVGYFFIDKFVAGIRPSFGYGSNNVGNSSSLFTIGPFVRYYFLRTENIVNLVSEANYAHGFFSGGNNSNIFSLYSGPVVYFNSSVGLEFLLGYSRIKNVGYEGNDSKIQFAIGFQFHLEREK